MREVADIDRDKGAARFVPEGDNAAFRCQNRVWRGTWLEEERGPGLDRRLGRLRFVIATGVFVLALLPNFGSPATASPRASGQIVANEVSQAWPARGKSLTVPNGTSLDASAIDSGATGPVTLLYSSDTIDARQLFDRIGVHWVAAPGAEGGVYVETRTSLYETAWTDWRAALEDEDMTNEETNEHFSLPALTEGGARYAQYRVWFTGGDPDAVERLNLTFLDVNDLNAGPVARLFNDIAGAFSDFTRSYAEAAPIGAQKILTRQDWGADEKLMIWPPRYQKVQKFIVHHTVTDDGGSNVAATIRSIYYFHAVTRGWGDIGYNYLVDKFGNIWTGRQGGDNVIAGHAYGWNNGSIGVAALGDYSSAQPTSNLQNAIASIIAMKGAQFGIQPFGSDTFTHQEQASDGSWVNVTNNPPNIQGHRDANYILNQHGGQTACPGNGIYNMLNGLRTLAQAQFNNGYFDLAYLEPALPKAGFPGAVLNVPVTVINRGKSPIPAGTTVSYKLLKNGSVAVGQGGAGTIAAAIPAGGSTTVAVPFTVPAIGSYIARFDLQTAGAWWNTTKNQPVRDMWFNSADWSVDWVKDNVPISWVAGETRPITVTFQNDGGRVWPSTGVNPVQLGYKWVSNATGNTFPGAQRIPLPGDIAPGATVTLTIPVTAPIYPTNYTMYLDLYKVNEFAFADKGIAPDDTPTGVSVDFKASYAVLGALNFSAGQAASVPLMITNTGKGTFPVTNSYPVNLGYHWYTTGGQPVVWDGVRTKLPADLLPGQQVQVQAQVVAPPQGGQYQLRFDLVQEGVAWFSGKSVAPGTVTTAVAGPVVKSYGAVYEPTVQTPVLANSTVTVPVTVKNTGNFAWSAAGPNPVTLSYHWYDSAGRTFSWDGLRTKLLTDLAPGGSVTLNANLRYPATIGSYTLRWDLVEEGVSWFSGKDVRGADQSIQVVSSLFYGGSMDVSGQPETLPTGVISTYSIKVQNLSNFDWGSNINLSYHLYDGSGKVVAWDGLRTSLAGTKVSQVRTIPMQVLIPGLAGGYTIKYDIVQEGVAWFSGQGMQVPSRVVTAITPQLGATYSAIAPVTASSNATIFVPVTVTNTGAMTWNPGTVNLAYHLYTASGAVFVWDGQRTGIPAPLGPGQSVTLQARVLAPTPGGTYTLRFDLVQEGVTWFSGASVPQGTTTLTVQ